MTEPFPIKKFIWDPKGSILIGIWKDIGVRGLTRPRTEYFFDEQFKQIPDPIYISDLRKTGFQIRGVTGTIVTFEHHDHLEYQRIAGEKILYMDIFKNIERAIWCTLANIPIPEVDGRKDWAITEKPLRA
jgi:hypothetical protein